MKFDEICTLFLDVFSHIQILQLQSFQLESNCRTLRRFSRQLRWRWVNSFQVAKTHFCILCKLNDFSNIFSFNHSFDRRNTRTFVCVCVSFWVEEGGLELLPTTLLVRRKFHLDVNWLLWISVPVTYSFLTTLVALETGRRSLNAA